MTALSREGIIMANRHEFDRSALYNIRVKGRLEADWSEWLGGFEIKPAEGETLLTGLVSDQSALYGLLAKLNELGFTLISVQRNVTKSDIKKYD